MSYFIFLRRSTLNVFATGYTKSLLLDTMFKRQKHESVLPTIDLTRAMGNPIKEFFSRVLPLFYPFSIYATAIFNPPSYFSKRRRLLMKNINLLAKGSSLFVLLFTFLLSSIKKLRTFIVK